MVNNKFQNIRFLYFFEYWPIPFGFYKHVVKSQDARSDFFLCKIHAKTHFLLKTQDNIYFLKEKQFLKKKIKAALQLQSKKSFRF